MAFYTPRNISPADQLLFDAHGNAVGIQAAGSSSQPVLGMTPAKAAAVDSLVSADGILPRADTQFPAERITMTATGGVCGAPCQIERIRCVTGTSVALTVYEGAGSAATTLLTATLSAGDEATIPGGRLRAINGVRAVFASGSFDFYIGTE